MAPYQLAISGLSGRVLSLSSPSISIGESCCETHASVGELERKNKASEIQHNMSTCRRAIVARPTGNKYNLEVGR